MQVDIFQHLVIDPFKWLPQNYRMIFPLLLEIYLQSLPLKSLFKTFLFQKAFPG